jgi:23S rRNA (pseudouridine1915-N3)-methyltransferase
MRITVITASSKQPDWVRTGFEEYARRLTGPVALALTEIPLPKRTRSSVVSRLMAEEGERMLATVPQGAHVVALDESGKRFSTAELARRLAAWLALGQPVALLIGGPDGLSRDCLERSAERWSLSPLTLPHGLVRIVVAEALYRAHSLLRGHPYHRA